MKLSVLNKKLKLIDEQFMYVNSGGCACVASMLSKHLRTIFPVMRITSSGNYGVPDIDKVRQDEGGSLDKYCLEANGFDFNHVWIEIYHKRYWYALDCTGVVTRKVMSNKWGTPAKGSFTFDEVDSMASDTDWNRAFDRDQLPAMVDLVAQEFEGLSCANS